MNAEWKLPLITVAGTLGVVVAAFAVWFFWFSGPSTEDIEEWTARDVTSYARHDAKLAPHRLDVQGVDLVHAGGNEYRGFVTVETRRGVERKVPISVTFDGGEGMWQIDRGGFLFLLDEPAASSRP